MRTRQPQHKPSTRRQLRQRPSATLRRGGSVSRQPAGRCKRRRRRRGHLADVRAARDVPPLSTVCALGLRSRADTARASIAGGGTPCGRLSASALLGARRGRALSPHRAQRGVGCERGRCHPRRALCPATAPPHRRCPNGHEASAPSTIIGWRARRLHVARGVLGGRGAACAEPGASTQAPRLRRSAVRRHELRSVGGGAQRSASMRARMRVFCAGVRAGCNNRPARVGPDGGRPPTQHRQHHLQEGWTPTIQRAVGVPRSAQTPAAGPPGPFQTRAGQAWLARRASKQQRMDGGGATPPERRSTPAALTYAALQRRAARHSPARARATGERVRTRASLARGAARHVHTLTTPSRLAEMRKVPPASPSAATAIAEMQSRWQPSSHARSPPALATCARRATPPQLGAISVTFARAVRSAPAARGMALLAAVPAPHSSPGGWCRRRRC
eukprot:scaffold659_cov329-Prasinococcus_capsulatus_cf.AAC.31